MEETMILGIYGAGGSGKLAVDLALRVDSKKERWSRIIFIDDVVEERVIYGTDVYRFAEVLENAELRNHMEILISLGDPRAREVIFQKVKAHGMSLATIIDQGACISPSLKYGEGVIICNAAIGSDTYIGDNTIIYENACIGHDVTIGRHNIISSQTFIAGHCHMKDRVFVAPSAAMCDRLTIEEDCVIAVGAALFKDMEKEKLAIGNPARIVTRNMEKRLFGKK